jgi:Amt family ammonium transporter
VTSCRRRTWQKSGFELVKFFFLLTFAAAIPPSSPAALPSAPSSTQLIATFVLVGLVYPFFEGIAWNHTGVQAWLAAAFGAEFHDFAGSVVVHAVGGWIALPAVLLLARAVAATARKAHRASASNIPFLALRGS